MSGDIFKKKSWKSDNQEIYWRMSEGIPWGISGTTNGQTTVHTSRFFTWGIYKRIPVEIHRQHFQGIS